MANRFDDLTVSEVTSLTLLSRAKQGDSVAMEALMGRYLVRLQRWAHGRLPLTAGTLLDTDDVVQRLLADALVANGELARAVAALDSASTPPGLLTTGDQEWLLARERLAALYRRVGRMRDGAAVEAQLRAAMAVADDDFPIKRRLAAAAVR